MSLNGHVEQALRVASEVRSHVIAALPASFDAIFVAYAALIVLAALPIYWGSYLALEEPNGEEGESLSKSDAYWFPVMGSAVLFSFYLLFRYFSKDYINLLLTAYFGLFGAVALTKLLMRVGACCMPEKCYTFDYYRVLVERKTAGTLFDIKVTWLSALAALLSAAFTAYYVLTKNWMASNVFGMAFSISAISLIKLDTFSTGFILLAGLFLYDIFWVFGTNVMVTVAKSFDVPVKLLFPRDLLTKPNGPFAMLGLGDIVIPGVLISLCLKFDHHNARAKNGGPAKKRAFPKPYFTVAMVFYVAGLLVTMAVMHVSKAAQPALLYLSPAGILAVLLTGLARGELKSLLAFTTEVEGKQPAADAPAKAAPLRLNDISPLALGGSDPNRTPVKRPAKKN